MATAEAETSEDQRGPPGGSVYDGFISYSHASDDLLAPRLQAGLQRFAKPWWKRRALRIFRDESSLSANPHLWSSITDALDQSGWFVLLLSPEAAKSDWVNNEVEYWLAHKDSDRIIPVLTDGVFGWADGDLTGDSVPRSLQDAFADEPRWVDLRFGRTEEQLDLSNPEFSAAIADIASAIRGVPKDELASEEVRQHRRTRRTTIGAAIALLVLFLGATAAAVYAAAQQSRANDEAQLARARALATASVNVLDKDPELSLLLAVASADAGNEVEFEQRRALHAAIDQDRAIVTMPFEGPWIWSSFATMTPDGDMIALFGQRGVIEFYEMDDPTEPLWIYDEVPVEYQAWPTFSLDGDHVFINVGWSYWDQGVPAQPPQPELLGDYLFDARTGAPVPLPGPPAVCTDSAQVSYGLPNNTSWATLGAHGASCTVAAQDGTTQQWWWVQDILSGEVLHGPQPVDEPLWAVATKGEGSILHYTTPSGLHLIDLESGVESFVAETVDFFLVAHDGSAYFRIDGQPAFFVMTELIDSSSGRVIETNADPRVSCNTGTLSADGLTIAVGCDNGTVRLLDRETGEVFEVLKGHDGWPGSTGFDYLSRFVIAGATDGVVKIWDLSPQGEVAVIEPPAGYIADASLSVVGSRAAVLVLPGEDKSPYSSFVSTMTQMAAGNALIFEVPTGAEVMRIPDVSGKVVRLSPDGSLLAAQTMEAGVLSSVAVFDVATGNRLVTMDGMCSWDPDVLAAAPFSADGTIGDCEEGELAGDVTDLAWSSDGSQLAMAGGSSQRFRVWDSRTGDVLFTSERLGFFTFALSAIQFRPDGSEVAVSSKTGMWVYDTDSWTEIQKVTHTGRPSWVIRYTPDGAQIVTAQAHSGSLRIYDADTYDETNHRASGSQSRDLALSSDGSLVALSSKEGAIYVIDMESGETVEIIDRVGMDITNVEFIDRDRHLIITGSTGPIEIVTLDAVELLDIARSRASRSFTATECETYLIDPCPTLDQTRNR